MNNQSGEKERGEIFPKYQEELKGKRKIAGDGIRLSDIRNKNKAATSH